MSLAGRPEIIALQSNPVAASDGVKLPEELVVRQATFCRPLASVLLRTVTLAPLADVGYK